MNKRRLIFFLVFAVYHLLAFIFTLVMQYNTGLLFKMVGYISWFKYGTLLGLILLVGDFVWWRKEMQMAVKEQDSARHENNTLKAKVYDLQEASKAKPVSNANN